MASILKGQSGQPIQFETKPNVNGDDVATESAISTPNNALIKSALNAGGDAPVYACRAWVNFDGTGTGAIRASGNVSSITDHGVGDFTVNFATGMVDSDFSTVGTLGHTATATQARTVQVRPDLSGYSSNSIRVTCDFTSTSASGRGAYPFISVTIFK